VGRGVTANALGKIPYMDLEKSLEEYEVFIALLHDAFESFGAVFNGKALRLTTQVVRRRVLN
jgi:hypothetical protein